MQQYLPRQSPSFSVVCTCLTTWNVFFPELELYACLACSARLALLFSTVKVSPWKVRVHSSGHGSLHDDTNTKAKCSTTTNVDSQHWTTFWEMGLTVVIVQLINMTAVWDVQKLLGLCSDYATGCYGLHNQKSADWFQADARERFLCRNKQFGCVAYWAFCSVDAWELFPGSNLQYHDTLFYVYIDVHSSSKHARSISAGSGVVGLTCLFFEVCCAVE